MQTASGTLPKVSVVIQTVSRKAFLGTSQELITSCPERSRLMQSEGGLVLHILPAALRTDRQPLASRNPLLEAVPPSLWESLK